eukprot:SM000324S12593  [mRNA]  locus=s324:47434:50769:- [translate_table: standard]
MEPEASCASGETDYTFAFNDPNFSDRVLRIEIIQEAESPAAAAQAHLLLPRDGAGGAGGAESSEGAGDGACGDPAWPCKKRRRMGSTDASERQILPHPCVLEGGSELLPLVAQEVELRESGEAGEADEGGVHVAEMAQAVALAGLLPRSAFLMSDAAQRVEALHAERRLLEATAAQDEEADVDELSDSEDGDARNIARGNEEEPGLADGQVLELATPLTTVKTLHINSAILAAKSPFFRKLFSNGMKESEERQATIAIRASALKTSVMPPAVCAEEEALLDMLQCMYEGRVKASSPAAVLDVLMIADKLQVVSCIRHCSKLLRDMPMTVPQALLYLDLPVSVRQAKAVQSLMDAARAFLASHFRDLSKCNEEANALPLVGIEAILASDLLHVASEDYVYDFTIRWARSKYPDVEQRRHVLDMCLAPLIRFSQMSNRKVLKALTCSDLQGDRAKALILEALHYRAEPVHRQKEIRSCPGRAPRFRERAYKLRPVKVALSGTYARIDGALAAHTDFCCVARQAITIDAPVQQCIVYFDLRIEEVRALYPKNKVSSHGFPFAGQEFYISAHCQMEQQPDSKGFGLFLGMYEKSKEGSASVAVDYEFAVRMKDPTTHKYPFITRSRSTYTFTGGKIVGYRNIFSRDWSVFVDDKSVYFLNGVLHLRAELTVQPQANIEQAAV